MMSILHKDKKKKKKEKEKTTSGLISEQQDKVSNFKHKMADL